MRTEQLEPRFISLDQAARVTQLSTRTLRRAIEASRLQCHRVGRRIRIDVVELERWIRANGNAAAVSTGQDVTTWEATEL